MRLAATGWTGRHRSRNGTAINSSGLTKLFISLVIKRFCRHELTQISCQTQFLLPAPSQAFPFHNYLPRCQLHISLLDQMFQGAARRPSYSPPWPGLEWDLAHVGTENTCWLVRHQRSKLNGSIFPRKIVHKKMLLNMSLVLKTIPKVHRSIVFLADNLIFFHFHLLLPVTHRKVHDILTTGFIHSVFFYQKFFQLFPSNEALLNHYVFLLILPRKHFNPLLPVNWYSVNWAQDTQTQTTLKWSTTSS